jgi:hypothetical protein
MTLPRAMLLTGAALALAVVNPAPVLADTTRTAPAITIEGSGTATSSVDLTKNVVVTHSSGDVSHLGHTTLQLITLATTSIPPDVRVASGNVTIVAANGDRLTGTWTSIARFTSIIPPDTLIADGVVTMTVTGGTGRFAGANGVLTQPSHAVYTIGATMITGVASWTLAGEIRFSELVKR